jgi:hypothetical protein
MEKMKQILLAIVALFAISCSEPTSPTKVDDISLIRIQIFGASLFPKTHSAYWSLPEYIEIVSDSLIRKGDTLEFFSSEPKTQGKLINYSKNTLSLEFMVTKSHWRYWYDYTKMKWESGYYNEETNYSRIFFKLKNSRIKEYYYFDNKSLIADSLISFSYNQSKDNFEQIYLIPVVQDSAFVKINILFLDKNI